MRSNASEYIKEEEIRAIAELARMNLSDTEISSAAEHISAVLGNFEIIRSVDTGSISAADNPSGSLNVTREDVVHEDVLATHAALLKNAKTQDGYIVVPAVFSS